MQRKNSFFSMLRDKGYYIALGVCALAVAISGLLYYRQAKEEKTVSVEPGGLSVVVMPQPTEREVLASNRSRHEDALAAALESLPPARESESTAPKPTNPGTVAAVKPVDGSVSLGYSMDKLSYNVTTRDWRTHAGMDIEAPMGSEVRAAADGTVLAVYEDELLGQTVTVEHDRGYVTHYANLAAEVEVRAGDAVKAGQVLGRIGSSALLETGSAPHLHFAVYRNNVPQDPEEFLAS